MSLLKTLRSMFFLGMMMNFAAPESGAHRRGKEGIAGESEHALLIEIFPGAGEIS